MAIQDNAVIVTASFSRYRPKVLDKKISREVGESHGTDESAGDFLKRLFPSYKQGVGKDSVTVHAYPEMVKLLSKLDGLYAWHAKNTLVWDGKGRRILPACTAEEHKEKFDAVIATLPDDLLSVELGFSDAILRASLHLNGMFKRSDYPRNGRELRDKFAVSYTYEPIPTSVTGGQLPGAVLTMINSSIEARVQSATENAMSDAWTRLYKCVEAFHRRLSEPGAIFRDSLVGNLRDVTDVLKKLNITGSAELESMRAKVATDLAKWDPATLRDSEHARASVAATANGILATMRGVRKITMVETEVSKREIHG